MTDAREQLIELLYKSAFPDGEVTPEAILDALLSDVTSRALVRQLLDEAEANDGPS